MMVVNKELGIPVCVQVNGVKYIIPGDRKSHFLPDEAYSGYKDLFIIAVPPAPKIPKFFIPLENFKKTEESPKIKIVNNKKGNPGWSRYSYEIIDPEGKIYKDVSLLKFCKERGLKFDMYYAACRQGIVYKGWKITRKKKEN